MGRVFALDREASDVRRAAKIDAPQVAIVQALRKAGCSVLSLAPVGHGCPDLLVRGRGDKLYLLEVKDGALSPSHRQLTPLQVSFHARWPVSVVTSVESALAALNLVKEQ